MTKLEEHQQREIEEHWAKVRAGLVKPEKHDFGADPKQRIRAERTKIQMHLKAAARHARTVEEICSHEG